MTEYVNGQAGAREDLCRFLAACYYEPTADFSAEHLFDSMVAAASAIDPELAVCARRLGTAFAAHDIETLLVDYARLFMGPSQPMAMPYASFWLTDDPSMRHEATMSAVDFYEQGGFDVSDEFRELPDHVAAELEFLYLLTFKQNRAELGQLAPLAQVDGSADELSAIKELRRRFLGDHLATWVGQFADAVKSSAEIGFYRELAVLTEHFVRIEAGLLRGH